MDTVASIIGLVAGFVFMGGLLLLHARHKDTDSGAPANLESFDLVEHLYRQRVFSAKTWGPGGNIQGVVEHIRKELEEIEASPTDIIEWADVILLVLDGAWRAGHTPEAICAAIVCKHKINEGRRWPDWRTMPQAVAIEHDRTLD